VLREKATRIDAAPSTPQQKRFAYVSRVHERRAVEAQIAKEASGVLGGPHVDAEAAAGQKDDVVKELEDLVAGLVQDGDHVGALVAQLAERTNHCLKKRRRRKRRERERDRERVKKRVGQGVGNRGQAAYYYFLK
jgi:hypothetical protein